MMAYSSKDYSSTSILSYLNTPAKVQRGFQPKFDARQITGGHANALYCPPRALLSNETSLAQVVSTVVCTIFDDVKLICLSQQHLSYFKALTLLNSLCRLGQSIVQSLFRALRSLVVMACARRMYGRNASRVLLNVYAYRHMLHDQQCGRHC